MLLSAVGYGKIKLYDPFYNKKNEEKERIGSNHEKYKNIPNQAQLKEEHKESYKPTSEEYRLFRESLIELRDSINGKGKGR